MILYKSCVIYKTPSNAIDIQLVLDIQEKYAVASDSELDNPLFNKIILISSDNGQKYYLFKGEGKASTRSYWLTLQAFVIEDQIKPVRLFPNNSATIFVDYDFSFLNPYNQPDGVWPIEISDDGMQLKVPRVSHGRFSWEFVEYVFNGYQYVIK
ncbi:hypothetical protein GC194_09720 [bacterium]|nr:hypothetical protein [bacterium]